MCGPDSTLSLPVTVLLLQYLVTGAKPLVPGEKVARVPTCPSGLPAKSFVSAVASTFAGCIDDRNWSIFDQARKYSLSSQEDRHLDIASSAAWNLLRSSWRGTVNNGLCEEETKCWFIFVYFSGSKQKSWSATILMNCLNGQLASVLRRSEPAGAMPTFHEKEKLLSLTSISTVNFYLTGGSCSSAYFDKQGGLTLAMRLSSWYSRLVLS
jgi:hypothetical protein